MYWFKVSAFIGWEACHIKTYLQDIYCARTWLRNSAHIESFKRPLLRSFVTIYLLLITSCLCPEMVGDRTERPAWLSFKRLLVLFYCYLRILFTPNMSEDSDHFSSVCWFYIGVYLFLPETNPPNSQSLVQHLFCLKERGKIRVADGWVPGV